MYEYYFIDTACPNRRSSFGLAVQILPHSGVFWLCSTVSSLRSMAGAVAHDHDARAREKEEEHIERGTHGPLKVLDNKPVAGAVTSNRLGVFGRKEEV